MSQRNLKTCKEQRTKQQSQTQPDQHALKPEKEKPRQRRTFLQGMFLSEHPQVKDATAAWRGLRIHGNSKQTAFMLLSCKEGGNTWEFMRLTCKVQLLLGVHVSSVPSTAHNEHKKLQGKISKKPNPEWKRWKRHAIPRFHHRSSVEPESIPQFLAIKPHLQSF